MNQVLKTELLSAVIEKVLTSLPTPQEIQEAKYQGSTAGQLLLAGGLNPYPLRTLLAVTWANCRMQAMSLRMSALAR